MCLDALLIVLGTSINKFLGFAIKYNNLPTLLLIYGICCIAEVRQLNPQCFKLPISLKYSRFKYAFASC